MISISQWFVVHRSLSNLHTINAELYPNNAKLYPKITEKFQNKVSLVVRMVSERSPNGI
jgi:hypothetical protein